MARVQKTRNAGTMTEAAFWGMIRSTLRRRTMYWKPISIARDAVKRKSKSSNPRLKWEYQCANCKDWFPSKETEVNHIEGAGSLRCAEDLPQFVERLFAEKGYECLCKPCHKKVTESQKKKIDL